MTQVEQLAVDHGRPREVEVELASIDFPPLSRRRHGEVCMAIRRKNGRFLLQTKRNYPDAVMRLPSGGIKKHESIESALLREVWEETNLDVDIKAFVAVINYRDQRARSPFSTYLFLLDETDGALMSNDPKEQISDWREAAPEELAAYSESLANIRGDWNNWGHFRATAIDTLAVHCGADTRPRA